MSSLFLLLWCSVNLSIFARFNFNLLKLNDYKSDLSIMSTTVKSLRAKLASCCLSCYLVPPSSSSSSKKSPPPPSSLLLQSSKAPSPPPAVDSHPPHSPSRIYQCPQCQTSLLNMSQHWLRMDSEREAWVMPQHLKDFKVKVRERERENQCMHTINHTCM